MPTVTIEIPNLEALRQRLADSPKISRSVLAQAINQGLQLVITKATDDNFMFKTPRPQRTGKLQLSFRNHIVNATEDNLSGFTGPTVPYAPWVHDGHSQQPGRYVSSIHKRLVTDFVEGNPFMPRIAQAAKPEIDERFRRALEIINIQIAKG